MPTDAALLEMPVGRLAVERPAAIAILETLGIDYCCGGQQPFGAACAGKGADPEKVLADIATAEARRGAPEPTSAGDSLAALVAHVVERYHGKLREDLPRLATMTGRVVKAHGERHPEMVMPMAETFEKLRAALEPHLIEEEDVLFPRLVALEMRAKGGRGPASDAQAERLLAAMVGEHDLVGALLARLREITGGYVAPADACGTFRGLLAGLTELEEEIHRHVHLENNILVPAARALLPPAPSLPAR